MDFIDAGNGDSGLRLETAGQDENRQGGEANRYGGNGAQAIAATDASEKTMVATQQIRPAIWGGLIGLFTFAMLQAGTGLWWAASIESRMTQIETRGSPGVERLLLQNGLLAQRVEQIHDQQQKTMRSVEQIFDVLQRHMAEQQRRQQ